MRSLFLIILIGIAGICQLRAQVQESFSDGDFTQNPAWVGDIPLFQVNAARQLQSKGPAVTGTTLQLATANQLAVGVQWEYYVQLALATSSGNYAEVHLTADGPELKGSVRGYFVRMGGTEDEVSLFRKDGSTVNKIINGPDKTIAASDNRFWVRVTRTPAHEWRLELDVTGTRQNYVLQGTVQDSRYTTSAYAGVVFRYSQANAQKFFFDDFMVRDVAAPSFISVVPEGSQALLLTFSEPLRESEARNLANYRLNGNRTPAAVVWQQAAPHQVRLRFDEEFATGNNVLEVLRAVDTEGNIAQNLTGSFAFAPPAAKGDVVITEIYADINPLQDLPAAEFIEIYNRSNKTFNLQGWKYSDATANAGTFPAYLLKPDTYIIICAAADTSLYKPFGSVVGLNIFPSLNDSGDDVELFDAAGQLIDLVRYTSSWYREAAKREGGWSLELMQVNSLCTGASQWKASENPRGGTPGQPNSLRQTDAAAPVLLQAFATGPEKIWLQFDEPLDSLDAAEVSKYAVSPGVAVSRVQVTGASLSEVELTLATPLQPGSRYVVTVQGLRDCTGNRAVAGQQRVVVLPASAQAGDVVVNEILFNPRTGGVDFVELVNRSGKVVSLQNWRLANREAGGVANERVITAQPLLLEPGQYLVLTSSPEVLLREYPAGNAERFWGMGSLPSYPDAAGTVVLLLPDRAVADEVGYQSSQHFRLISDAEGVSLERISVTGPSVAANFHSAATPVGATPGYENSQAQRVAATGKLTLTPKTFTPDGDGQDDALLLQFNLPQPGFAATVTIFDAHGRLVRKLAGNTLLGAETLLQWDGLTDSGGKAAVGYYVVLVELFNLQGGREVLKETAVVGGRF
ncbi:lamin tail domain-containing protein [Rufibacter quisquiliarum]|uniref:Methionine-rich copper-binding protein CopC n=1 Tax=Rufibacter quisquiliarum TaxID=1549639 RepID=A0A839GM34_9BACT|nr:lamin tail domain-containing protein [Rufibacter quisquiliarum]MBA9076635.1 methionine-rich copper-binding protein CopC [Rufibacter quisquiliarum]